MMNIVSLTACKAFLDRYPADLKMELIKLLPLSEQTAFLDLPEVELKVEYLKREPLNHVHFSWLAPYLRTLAERDIRFFLAALNQTQIKGLKKTLGFADDFPHLTKLAKLCLRKILWEHTTQNQPLISPIFLPYHPLNFLLDLSEKEIMTLICYLGLHDLSFEMRQIIATASLKKIFGALEQKEGAYLNTLLLHREPLIFKRLFLETWDGSRAQMRKILEERGIHRLAHALYDSHPSFIWSFTHQIDMHLATLLLKYKEKPTNPRAEKILTDQITKILHFLNPEGSS